MLNKKSRGNILIHRKWGHEDGLARPSNLDGNPLNNVYTINIEFEIPFSLDILPRPPLIVDER